MNDISSDIQAIEDLVDILIDEIRNRPRSGDLNRLDSLSVAIKRAVAELQAVNCRLVLESRQAQLQPDREQLN